MPEINLQVAGPRDFSWAQDMVTAYHYLHKPVDPRSRPLAYVVHQDSERVGCLLFGRPQSTCCYRGGLTYGSHADRLAGRAVYDRWEVLNLARVWLDQRVQAGGEWCRPELVPGFVDRRNIWRPAVASWTIHQALRRVGFDYLLAHPPCFVEQPYEIRVLMSYCDTRLHRGAIYRAAGLQQALRNQVGIETWWTAAVWPLSPEQDAIVRQRSATDHRAARVRGQRHRQPLLFTEEN